MIKLKSLFMALTGVTVINIDSITIHIALNLAVGSFAKNLQHLSDKMDSSLRNKLSDLKDIIIHKISIKCQMIYCFIII